MRTLLHVWRDYPNNSDQTKYWLSARSNPFYSSAGVQSQIQNTIGAVLVPQTPVKFVSEMWMNGQQAFHQLGSISNGSRCYYANWNQSAYYDTNTYGMGTFAFAQNFDSFLNKSDSLGRQYRWLQHHQLSHIPEHHIPCNCGDPAAPRHLGAL